MPAKPRTLEEKIGPTVIEFVAKAIETLADRDTRMKLFLPHRSANLPLVSKLRRDDLIEAMARIDPQTRRFPKESLKRALSAKVQFLTDKELKSGKKAM